MNRTSFYIYSLILAFLASFHLNAQNVHFIEGVTIEDIDLFDDQYYVHHLPIKGDRTIYKVELLIQSINQYATQESSVIYHSEKNLDFFIGTANKEKIARILVPYYVEKDDKKGTLANYQLAVHYQAKTNQENSLTQQSSLKSATQSLLSSGNWYKIAVPKEGIYRIDRKFLTEQGIAVDNVNFQHLRIFGHGGTIISENVEADQPDDLMGNAIFYSSNNTNMSAQDYVLFYATGPTKWIPSNNSETFEHQPHYYEDQSYYFITFDHGAGPKIQSQNHLAESPSIHIHNSSDYYLYHQDSIHPSRMGKQWYSHRISSMGSSNMVHQRQLPIANAQGEVKLRTKLAVASNSNANIASFSIDNQSLSNESFAATGINYKIRERIIYNTFQASGGNQTLKIQYQINGNGTVYLGFIEANFKRPILFNSAGRTFNSFETNQLTDLEFATFHINSATSQTKVWNITNPNEVYEVAGQLNGSEYVFNDQGGKVQNYITFSGNDFPKPSYQGTVENQNLHNLSATEYLIISPNQFLSQANELADFHRNKYETQVTVVDLKKIYNEFSSGSQDIAAIRNFIKMLYERGSSQTVELKNVLLFGSASFDYKNKIQPNTNLIPTYQTLNSEGYVSTYPTDDFFALLDDGESINSFNSFMDVGIGRIPATNVQEAQDYINKLKHYHGPASFGSWKMQAALVADDKEAGMNHLADCESISQPFINNLPEFTIHKIYSDAHPVVSGASGNRYPTMNQAINERIYQGTFYMSYSGHGSPVRWSHEAILTPDDYDRWTNIDALPLMITATCDFGRYDEPNPEDRSAGTKILLNNKGGAIAMMTTTQAVYASSSTTLTTELVNQTFQRNNDGSYPSLGQSYMNGKNSSMGQNAAKFALLGDPGMTLAFPKHQVLVDSVVEITENGTILTDTFSALGKYKIYGSIENYQNQLQSSFDGTIELNLFGQKVQISTVNSFAGTTPSFESQTNIIVNQKGVVENGQFELEIIVPKDINFEYGDSKIGLYAFSDEEDAMGVNNSFTIGGYSNNSSENDIPPTVKVYLYDSVYHYSGFTDPDPVLFIDLEDDIGFNISGSSVGHDLIAILNEDFHNPMILNNFFESSLEGPHKGHVYYPLYNLPEGEHVITVRAWDVHNNMGEGHLRFVVKKQDEDSLEIRNLINFPNPFKEATQFVFEHNLKHHEIDIKIDIYSTSGQHVKLIEASTTPSSNKVYINWSGEDENDQPLPKGIYFYKVSLLKDKKIIDQAYQKLLLLR